ncbi:MAG: FkbM family methyltransferase, partial [Armatimonadetes bacterium]|nr:FkbM family methyltransferase [Armatimonadota bacterium]
RDGAPDYTFVEREERGTGAAVEGQVRRLGTLMEQFGHPTIHLLKLDIEGAEYPVLADLVRSKLDVRQIVVEFHHRWPEFGETKTREAVNLLHTAGFRIFALVKNRDYSLIRTDRP